VVGAAIRPVPDAAPPAEADLAAFCRSRLASFKVPARWLFVGSLPLTSTGKVRKDQLSELLAGPGDPPA
jgi:acyl-CoA synthetase (AMP-forming)/AMP-acid ligase II